MVDLKSTEVSDIEKKILCHPNVGALVLFTRNFINPEQLQALLDDVRSVRPDIFIAIDHEGGNVQRFQRHGFRSLPAARVYGDVFDLNNEVGIQLARQYGEDMANDLLAYGIDLSLAPVVDLHGESNVIGKLDRAFHTKPEVVELLAEAFIDGMNKAGMPAVAKHFPGHGSTLIDSHIGQPTCDKTEKDLRETDLKPFRGLIEKNKLGGIMPAHITYPHVDSQNIASFSTIWLQGILREQLGYQGIILSDCLSMKGADCGDLKTRSELALKAGCDMLILSNQEPDLLLDVLNTVSIEQSQESIKRLELFKMQMNRFNRSKNTSNEARGLSPHKLFAAGSLKSQVMKKQNEDNEDLNKTTSI